MGAALTKFSDFDTEACLVARVGEGVVDCGTQLQPPMIGNPTRAIHRRNC